MSLKRVAVLGAGFSGLTLARALKKRNVSVELFESRSSPGGLIQTSYQKVIVESAAHAMLASQEVEELFAELKIELVKAGYVSDAKWIFREQPKKWPLTFKETLRSLGLPKKPLAQETVADWVNRNSSSALNDFFVAPALQGIYGAQTNELSASLVLGAFFDKSLRAKKGKLNGSVAPLNGMSELLNKLAAEAKVNYNSSENLESLKDKFEAVIVATGITEASNLLQHAQPDLSQKLSTIPKVSLLSATISFKNATPRIRGFGCLFPAQEKFESLGVLFNSDIFPKRGANNETWIFSGDHEEKSSQMILKKIHADRKRIDPTDIDVDFCEMHRWPRVLPLYGLELEKVLSQWPGGNPFAAGAFVKPGVYLTGNYLGGIGLSKILSYNERLAQKIVGDSK